jgi:anaerobic magnesium-protoporphyrin IX monomethyl ester cyclase
VANVLLVSPPYIKKYMRNARCDFVGLSNSDWYPIWLGQAGAYLESKGHKTCLLDAQVLGMSTLEVLDEIKRFDADIVAVYTGRMSEDSDIEFADTVAAMGRTPVLIGPYASIDPEGLLKKTRATTLLIQREFDLPLEELASGADPKKTPNFLVKDLSSDEIVTQTIRPLYKTELLDTFPISSEYFHKNLDIRRYKSTSELHPFMDVMSGRGCAWGRCNFCLWVHTFIPGTVYNLRSIEHFMGEFDYIIKYLPDVKSVMVQDDMMTNKRGRQIAEAILQRGYKIRWSCYAKPNSKFKQDTLHLMRRSGCLNLHVGFESGDNRVLEEIDKGTTIEQAKEFSEMAHKADLQIHGDFAMGHLGDTQESMQRTVDLAKAINPHSAQFQVMIPFRGTRFWQQLDERGAWSAGGEPSYEKSGGASSEEIRAMAKSAYRQFYISRTYLTKLVKNPRDYFFNRFDQYARAIPAVTWKRWVK